MKTMTDWNDKLDFKTVETLTATFALSKDDIKEFFIEKVILYNAAYYTLSVEQQNELISGSNTLTLIRVYSF